ncbi:MAG: phosphotransacetylase family protein [Coriobacteriia bacterium]|nr:phosphotransacetylase family protein [Coriobacteriia bacterium]
MKTIVVTSTRPYTGKSGIALTLIGILADRGLDVGYFKPYGTMPVHAGGLLTDEDALYINRSLKRPSELADVCPVVRSQSFVEDVLAGADVPGLETVRDAFHRCAAGRDIMVVEGPTEPAQGTAAGLSPASVADLLDACVLVIDRPRPTDLPEDALFLGSALGSRLGGVVLNGIHEAHTTAVAERVVPFLESRGIPVFGALPHDPALGSVTVAEIVDALGGTVLTATDRLGDTVETFMVGAMGQDKALRFFRRKARKAVITGGDRADVQLAALETNTRCIVLTGNMPPGPAVAARAEELGVPMVLVETDTLSAVETLDALIGRMRLHDPDKAARIRGMFEREVDTRRLFAAFGID